MYQGKREDQKNRWVIEAKCAGCWNINLMECGVDTQKKMVNYPIREDEEESPPRESLL